MESEKYLKPHQYYVDRYDLWTIEKCLDVIDTFQKVYKECLVAEELKDLSQEEKARSTNQMLGWDLFVLKTREYEKKEEKIKKWMEEDRKEQDKYDNTPEPQGIRCTDCSGSMHSTFKTTHNDTGEPSRMLFFFTCSSCDKRRAVWENGEEWESKPQLCQKCNKEVESSEKRDGDVITWTVTCSSCGFTESTVDDLGKSRKEREESEKKDALLLEKFRSEFCLSEKQGKENVATLESMRVADVVYEEELQKYDGPAYQQSAELNRINTIELEKRLGEPLAKENYVKFALDKPEEGRFFIIPFSVQDADSSRKENDSVHNLEKLLKESLKDTNWRLMSGHISYRLGYISGRIRGYESDEDLMQLYKKDEEKKSSKIDDAMRQKYEYSSWVKLARIGAKHKGIENLRKRRLEKEPEGFFLEVSEGPIRCGICDQSVPGNASWWTLDGITCADCHRNIKEGVIPDLTKYKDDTWFSGYDMKSKYSIPPMTRKKLERQGLFRGRELKKSDGSAYYTVYLVEDNEEFFKEHPPKPELDIKMEWGEEGKIMVSAKKIEYPEDAAKKLEKEKKKKARKAKK